MNMMKNKINGKCSGQYTSESYNKVYLYNSDKQAIERRDSIFQSPGLESFEWKIKKINFKYNYDSIYGVEYTWDVDFDVNNNLIYVPKDTAFFYLMKMGDFKLNFKVYNSKSYLLANEYPIKLELNGFIYKYD